MKTMYPASKSGSILKRFESLFRRLVLPWIGISLFLYFLVHSPARDWIAAAFGMASRGCFFCTYAWTAGSILASLSALFLVTASLVGAWIIADVFDGPAYDRLLAFGISVLAFAIVPATILGAAAYFAGQHFLRPPAGPLLSSLPAVAVVVIGLRKGWRPHRLELQSEKLSPLTVLVVCLAVVLMISTAAVSWLHPPTGYDALGYHGPMAVFFWQDGNIGNLLDRDPVTWALAHPGAVEVWTGLLRILGGQPLANLSQLPFALLGGLAAYAFTRRLGLDHDAALLSGSAFMMIPMVVIQSGMQLNDLAGAALWMSGAAMASRPRQAWNKRWLGLISVCLGLVVTTKLVLFPGAAILGLFVLVALLWQSRRPAWTWTAVGMMALLFLVVVSPWWLRNLARYSNPVFPQALPLIGNGYNYAAFNKADLAFVPRKAAWLIYPLIEQHEEQSGLGAVFAMTCLPGFVMAARRGQRQPVLLFLALTTGMLLAWWFLSEHFPRFLLGPVGLCMAFVPWALRSVPQNQRRLAAVLLAAAAVFSASVTFYQALAPLARLSTQPAEFYNQVWGVDPAAQSLPESEGLLWVTGYAPDVPEYTAYLPLLGPSGTRLVLPSSRGTSIEAMIQRMRASGIRYIYVPASPQNRAEVEKLFDPQSFELVSQSQVVKGDLILPRRVFYRAAAAAEEDQAVTRYLFRWK